MSSTPGQPGVPLSSSVGNEVTPAIGSLSQSGPPPATPDLRRPVTTPSASSVSPPAPIQPLPKWGKGQPQALLLRQRLAEASGASLIEALRVLLSQADDTLFKFAEQATGGPNQEFLAAFKGLRQHRTAVERSFREGIESLWRPAEKKSVASMLSGLSLVNEEELEENLAENVAVAQCERLLASEASALCRRLAIIDGVPEDTAPSNPLAPSGVAEVFKASLREVVDMPTTAKMIVFKLFDRHVLTIMPELHAQINEMFIQEGVLPDLKPIIVKSSKEDATPPAAPAGPLQGGATQGGAKQGGTAGSGETGAAGAGAQGGYDGPLTDHMVAWETVQSLLASHRSPSPMVEGQDGTLVPAPAVPMTDLMDAINRLNASVAKLDDIEPLAFKSALNDMIAQRNNKDHDHPETLGDHEDVIDMIDLLFDFVLRNSELPSQMQSILVRLQMPYLRMAVLEPGLFADEKHPAKLLLNRLAEAGKTWTEAADRDGDLHRLIEQTVEQFLEDFEQGAALCGEMINSFETQWHTMREKSSRVEKRIAEAAGGKEKLERARHASAKVIINNMAGLVLPDKLRMAIHRAWAHHLTMLALREGETSTPFRRAAGVIEQIALLSRTPATTSSSNSARKGEIDLLIKDWSAGLGHAGLTEQEVASWTGVLADFLHERSGLPRVSHAGSGENVQTLLHEDIAATVTQSALPDEAMSQSAMAAVSALKNGMWVEWLNPPVRAKLAFIGGFTNKLMFVDHRGNKAVETLRQILAREIEQGQALVLSEAPLVDQAFGSIERKLATPGQLDL